MGSVEVDDTRAYASKKIFEVTVVTLVSFTGHPCAASETDDLFNDSINQ